MIILKIVLFCLGLRIVTDEHQLLYFVREYFENRYHKLKYIGKPLVLCITCMASIWGTTIYIYYNGFTIAQIPEIIISCISASFIQTFIWKLYAKLD